MTTPQSHASAGSDSSSPSSPSPSLHHSTHHIHQLSTTNAPPALQKICFPSTASDSRPTISPSTSSSSSSSTSSLASNSVQATPSTPPLNPNKGFNLPRFSLWGGHTPDTLITASDSANSLSSPPNIAPDFNKLQITTQRLDSLHNYTKVRHQYFGAESPSQPLLHPASASAIPMPALTINEPAAPPPMSSPKFGSVWRLSGGVFASSAASTEPQRGRPQTVCPTLTRDANIVPPASQFAAWSEPMHASAPPKRSTTSSSSASSTACSSSFRPSMKKIGSQESIRSAASARVTDAESGPSIISSIIPTPKATKTKLRSKSKAGKEVEFERVFLAQELHSAPSTSLAGSLGRMGSDARSPSLVQTEFFDMSNSESRRNRSSWAPRRSTSPQAAYERRSTDLACLQPRASIPSSSDDHAHTLPRGRVDRQPSTSSHLTTASSAATNSTNASDTVPPKSPILGASKASAPKRKTYALQFSLDGRYLAAAGSDHLIRVYEVIASPTERAEELCLAQMQRIEDGCLKKLSSAYAQVHCPASRSNTKNDVRAGAPELAPVFKSTPVRIFAGHTGDVLDLSWSKNNFLLSCGSDKTAKLWHPNRSDCLCTFATLATVSSVDFHPNDDRFFVTGGLDGKLRLWNISARRVQSINDVPGVITAVAFSSSGSVVCVGTHSGSMLTFSCSDALTYVTTVTVKSAAASKTTQASKITSIHPVKLGASHVEPASTSGDARSATSAEKEYMTVTSNDSRVRIYSISSRRLISRFKSNSYLNRSSQIRATSSCDSQFIVSGSEDASIHVWSLASNASLLASLFSGMKRNKSIKSTKGADVGDNSAWRSWQAGSGSVRCAIFAPVATADLLAMADDPLLRSHKGVRSRIVVSTDDSNAIKVWRTDPHAILV